MSLVQSVDGCQETWGGCHGREFCIMLLHAGHRSLIEPLDHCAMHARRPADFTVSGPFSNCTFNGSVPVWPGLTADIS